MRYAIAALLFALVATGCVREIDIENRDARITSIGPLGLDDADNVIVQYTIRDPEGDDQDLQIEICTAPGEQCGFAAEGIGGDPTSRVPTVPAGTDVTHEFRWAPWCDRWRGTERIPSEPDQEYVVGITVLTGSASPVYSEPFTLTDLGTTGGDCPE